MNNFILGGSLLLGAGLVLWLAVAGAYSAGYEKAVALGRVDLAAAREKWADESRQAAEKHRETLQNTIAEYERRVASANDTGKAHMAKGRVIEGKKQEITRKIPHVTENSTHVFEPGYVRLCNQAVGADDGAVPAAACAAEPHSAAGAGAAPGAGLRR